MSTPVWNRRFSSVAPALAGLSFSLCSVAILGGSSFRYWDTLLGAVGGDSRWEMEGGGLVGGAFLGGGGRWPTFFGIVWILLFGAGFFKLI